MRCLITGITGFIGQALARCLRQQARVEVWGLASPRAAGSAPDLPEERILRTDLSQVGAVFGFVRSVRPDVIFHLAGKTRSPDLVSLLESNLNPTRVILEIARELDCRVLIPGSAAEYGVPQRLPLLENHPIQPVTPYGKSKAEQTALALAYAAQGLRIYVARTFNLIGPGLPESFLCADLVAQLARGSAQPELVLPEPDLYRDFLDVRDAVGAYWQIVLRGQAGEIYNVCSGTAYSLGHLARELLRLANRRRVFQVEYRANSVPAVVIGSNRKLRAAVGWSPRIPVVDSLADMLAYERSATAAPVHLASNPLR